MMQSIFSKSFFEFSKKSENKIDMGKVGYSSCNKHIAAHMTNSFSNREVHEVYV